MGILHLLPQVVIAEALKITFDTRSTTHALAIVRVRLVHQAPHTMCTGHFWDCLAGSYGSALSLPFREGLQNTNRSYAVEIISSNEDLIELNYSYHSTP